MSLDVNVRGNVMHVRVEQRDRFVFLVQIDGHQVAKRDDAGQASLVEHDEVPHARLSHPLQAGVVGFADLGDDQLDRHDVGDGSGRGVETGGHDTREDVALGEDAGKAVSIHDRNGADSTRRHELRRF